MTLPTIAYKGVPTGAPGQSLAETVVGLSLLDDALMLPAALLKASALDNNCRWMRAFTESRGLSFAPHAKTTMSPELVARQLADGAWGITAATVHHVRLYVEWGVRRIVLANQLVGRANIETVVQLLAAHPALDFYCLVDSVSAVEQLAAGARRGGLERPIQVLLELGGGGQRTGARSAAVARDIARACAGMDDAIALRGFECFEGVYTEVEPAEALLARLVKTASALQSSLSPGELIVSAGGTAFFDLAAKAMVSVGIERPVRFVLRSGCYITHDHLNYERSYDAALVREPRLAEIGRPQPALEVWAHVQSRPEPTRVVASLGKRDVGNDVDLPVLQWVHRVGRDVSPRDAGDGISVVKLYDQHACLELPADCDLAVGDLVGFGVSHPCTTFDKWRALFVVDDDYCVVDVVRTFF